MSPEAFTAGVWLKVARPVGFCSDARVAVGTAHTGSPHASSADLLSLTHVGGSSLTVDTSQVAPATVASAPTVLESPVSSSAAMAVARLTRQLQSSRALNSPGVSELSHTRSGGSGIGSAPPAGDADAASRDAHGSVSFHVPPDTSDTA